MNKQQYRAPSRNARKFSVQDKFSYRELLQQTLAYRDHFIDVVCRAAMIKRYGAITPGSLEVAKKECQWVEQRTDDGVIMTMMVTASDMTGPLFCITETRLQDVISLSWESFIGPLDITPEQLKDVP